MAISGSKAAGRLSVSALTDFLVRRSLRCFVGPEFSLEWGAPHFRDIQSGLWSTRTNRLNAFNAQKNRAMVLE